MKDTAAASIEIPFFSLLEGRRETNKLERAKIERVATGKGIVDLSMLNPDIAPPRLLQDRLVEAALNPTSNRYSVSRGIRKLREAFCFKYHSKWGVTLNPESQVCVTMGAKDATLNILRLLAEDSKKRILLPSPCYPAHRVAAELANLELFYFNLSSDQESMLEEIKSSVQKNSIDILFLNFPNNPTGLAVSPDFMREIVDFSNANRCFLLHDFVYGEMNFNRELEPSILQFNKEPYYGMAEIYSMSKAYSIPGWRVAVAAGDAQVIGNLSKLKSKVDYGNFLPIQLAASHALFCQHDLIEEVVKQYASRSKLLVNGLEDLGWMVQASTATPMLWCNLPEHCKLNALEFCATLIRDFGVSVAPGCDYGEVFDNYIRIALVASEENLQHLIESISSISGQWS